MTKKIIIALSGVISICVIIAFSSVPAASGPKTAEKEVIELSLSDIFPPLPSIPALQMKHFAEQIHRRTQGKVEIKMYGQSLVAPMDLYDGVVSGLTDIGDTTPAYHPGRFPASDAVQLPLPFKNMYVSVRSGNDYWFHFKPKENDDIHMLFLNTMGPYIIASRNKPINKPEDMRGLTIRATGGFIDYAKELGAEPVAVPSTEIYESLSKGVIEAAFIPAEMLKGFNLAEIIKYAVVAPLLPGQENWVFMNSKKYQSLPQDVKKVFDEVSEEAQEWAGKIWWYSQMDGEEYALSKGVELIRIPDTERPKWEIYAKPVIDRYIAKASAKGHPAKEYVKYFQERIEYWNSNCPDEKSVKDWIARELLVLKK